ncbi:MAG: ABC transporter permease [Desulfovibrionales bacterium]|nr:ABC transporter permease [Desulfovibrionales bacterium]
MTLSFVEQIGAMTLNIIGATGRFSLFLLSGFIQGVIPPFPMSKILDQMNFIGAKSIFVIVLTGLFTGMVLGLQGYYTLMDYGSVAALGSAVALTIVRELGPVLAAVMITARSGSAMAAEIGVMRISEQIDALVSMQIHPIRFIFSPRLVAALICFPFLTAVFDVVGIMGGYVTGSLLLGINGGVYMDKVVSSVEMIDVTGGFIKSFIFAVVVTSICCYRGYYAHLSREVGAKAVSMATTNAVVHSCVFILIWDYIITYFLV